MQIISQIKDKRFWQIETSALTSVGWYLLLGKYITAISVILDSDTLLEINVALSGYIVNKLIFLSDHIWKINLCFGSCFN